MAGSLDSPVTDIHTHVVPGRFPASIANLPCPFEIRPTCDCGRADVYVDGRQFRTVTDECWDIERRLDSMDRMGVGRQILSPMPELLCFWRGDEEAGAIADHVNAAIEEMVSRAPSRFSALGMVPLQDPDRAIRMLAMLMESGAFRGVEIGTNINGVSLGDDRFWPFFAAAEELGASVFIHPVRPVVSYPVPAVPAWQSLAAFPCETGLAATALIAAGLILRFPRLRLAFSHGGGALALLLPRLDHGWRNAPGLHEKLPDPPSVQARCFYYDTLVYDRDTLRFLIDSLGSRQLCIGTDQPFAIAEQDPLRPIAALGLHPDEEALLLRHNAARFLGDAATA